MLGKHKHEGYSMSLLAGPWFGKVNSFKSDRIMQQLHTGAANDFNGTPLICKT